MNQFKPKELDPKVTSKGTVLPLLNLKGKAYLQVAHRLVWFREEHPEGQIVTEILKLTDTSAIVKAVVHYHVDGKVAMAVAHKNETAEGFPDFIEKAETGAIGRALAIAGYGTQFEPELDEAERLADAPVPPPTKAKPSKQQVKEVITAPADIKTRDEVNALITSTSKVAIARKKVADVSALKDMLKSQFGVEAKEALTDEQAKAFLEQLTALIN